MLPPLPPTSPRNTGCSDYLIFGSVLRAWLRVPWKDLILSAFEAWQVLRGLGRSWRALKVLRAWLWAYQKASILVALEVWEVLEALGGPGRMLKVISERLWEALEALGGPGRMLGVKLES